MPRKAKELSPLAVKNLIRPGLHAVGGVAGLCLQVKESRSRSWLLRVNIGGKRREVGLGGYPDVTLAHAREKAREFRSKIDQGIDPVEERRAAKNALRVAVGSNVTFSQAAQRWHAAKSHEYRNPKHAKQVLTTLKKYADPHIGNIAVSDISVAHIMKLLEPIWTTKTETASRLRGRIENVLAWATVYEFRSGENPARWKGNLDALLPKPGKVAAVAHFKALPIDDVPKFRAELVKVGGIGSRALEFAMFTAARSGEVRNASWNEISFEDKAWTIPKERMKAGREHRVPLSAPALYLLKSLPRHEGTNLIFPSPRGKPLSDMTLSAVMRRMNVSAVPHGLRSTFRDWVADRTNFSSEVAEMALAHKIENRIEAAYRRGDLFKKREDLMNEWANFCVGQPCRSKK